MFVLVPIASSKLIHFQTSDDGTFDVLTAHHKRNKPTRAPNPQRLKESAHKHAGNRNNEDDFNNEDDVVGNLEDDPGCYGLGTPSDDEEEDNLDMLPRAKRHSKTPYHTKEPNPTLLQFYPAAWKDVLEDAKDDYALLVFTKLGFTNKEEHLPDAGACLIGAIKRHQEAGCCLDEGD